jgi:hypothetical protein
MRRGVLFISALAIKYYRPIIFLAIFGIFLALGVIYKSRAAPGIEPASQAHNPPQILMVYVSNPYISVAVSSSMNNVEGQGEEGLLSNIVDQVAITIKSVRSFPGASVLLISNKPPLYYNYTKISAFGLPVSPVYAVKFSLAQPGAAPLLETVTKGSVTTYYVGDFSLGNILVEHNGSIFARLPSLNEKEVSQSEGGPPLLVEESRRSMQLKDVRLNPGPAEEGPMQELPSGYEPPGVLGELFWTPIVLDSTEVLQGAASLLSNMQQNYMTPSVDMRGTDYIWNSTGGVQARFKYTKFDAADSQTSSAFISGIAFGVAFTAAIALVQELPKDVSIPTRWTQQPGRSQMQRRRKGTTPRRTSEDKHVEPLPGKGDAQTSHSRQRKGGLLLPTDAPSPAPLNWLERTCCIIVGVIASGAGGYVAFERSNQLSSAVLLVIGAVFLIVGIQGTRLMRFTSGSNIVELEQKKRIIADAIEKAQDEGNIEKASGIVEGAAIAAPALGLAKNVGLQYEFQVAKAIVDIGYLVTPSSLDKGFDLIVRDGSARIIYAELKRLSKPVPRQLVEALIYRTSTRVVPVVLITYTELSRAAQEAVSTSGNLEVVQWRDENDDDRLAETLRRMFASISSSHRITIDDQLQ